jgi:predicted nucleotidyltransferase component of viral defense system
MNIIFKKATNFRINLETHLKNIVRAKGEKLQRLKRKVAFDRFLARLFSVAEPNFFLKGGYAMELRLKTARVTRDVDLTTLRRSTGDNDLLSQAIAEELRELAQKDIGDFFTYDIGETQIDLENAPYGGARYPVTAFLDDQIFDRFHLDVGADVIVSRVEIVKGEDWLGFCGIPSPTFTMVAIEQQFAEKLHAYTLPRPQENTRVKDLIDMVLLKEMRSLNLQILQEALRLVFKIRGTHPLPENIQAPPESWKVPYDALAKECALTLESGKCISRGGEALRLPTRRKTTC